MSSPVPCLGLQARRPGFSLAEFLITVLVVGILSAIALPSYQKVTNRARAARIISDMNAVRTAAYQYQAETGEWPADAWTAVFPPELDDYLTAIDFTGPGYQLDWDNWGPYQDIGHVLGISVFVDDPQLENALLGTLRASEGTFMRVDHRYTYFVED